MFDVSCARNRIVLICNYYLHHSFLVVGGDQLKIAGILLERKLEILGGNLMTNSALSSRVGEYYMHS